MRTEEDLRHALRSLEPSDTHNPALLDRVRAGAARRHRNRVARVVAASVVAVTAAAAVPIAAHQLHRASPDAATGPTASRTSAAPTGTANATPAPTGAPARLLLVPWSLDPVPGYRTVGYRTETGRRSVQIAKTSDHANMLSAVVVVFDAGRYDATAVRAAGTPVQVNGRPGYYASARVARASRPALLWEYADNAWAQVQGDWPTAAATRTEELKLARAMRFDQPHMIRVGYRIRTLPPGLVVTYANYVTGSAMGKSGPILDVQLGRPGARGAVDLLLSPGTLSGSTPPTTTVGGDPARVDARSVMVQHDGYLLTASLTADSGRLTAATLRQLVSELTWAPRLGDLSTWFDGTTLVR